MKAMMKQVSAIRFSAYAAMAMTLALAITVSAQAQTDASQPTSADLAKRVDDLEKELAAVKAQMAATPAPAPAAAPAGTAAVANLAPAAPSAASRLGPVTMSPFVDPYCGSNPNQPESRTTA